MCSQCLLIDTINNALHQALKAQTAREDSSTPVEHCWMFRTACANYLFDALEYLGLRVVGRPADEEHYHAWRDQLQAALAYYAGDVRVIISILPRGAGMKMNG